VWDTTFGGNTGTGPRADAVPGRGGLETISRLRGARRPEWLKIKRTHDRLGHRLARRMYRITYGSRAAPEPPIAFTDLRVLVLMYVIMADYHV
jgi:hypothetical protein